ncbi:glycosyltransferase family 2 protein [Actinomycetes bacterium M1A6_2h]
MSESPSTRNGRQKPDISAVVVTYNAEEWTERALLALPAGAQRRSLELVVVDNASTELKPEKLRNWAGPDAKVTFMDTNVGFGRACNLAVTQASGEYVVLVNPDAVVDEGALDALVDFLEEDPARGIVGGRITAPTGELDYGSCWGHQTTWSLFCFATGLSTAFKRSELLNPEGLGSWRRDTPREVGIVTGCLLLARRSVWNELGGFDPRFFMYGEDADLCKRAWDNGYRPSVTPTAHAVHALGASSSSKVAKSILLFRGKVSLVDKSSRGVRRTLEMRLLRAGVAVRALGSRLTGRGGDWIELWRRREEWQAGW